MYKLIWWKVDEFAIIILSTYLQVEEGCHLKSSEEIAGAVHQMLIIIEGEEEEEAIGLPYAQNLP